MWVLRSPGSQSYWQKITLSFDLSSPHQHLYYNYLSFVTVRTRCNNWETSKPVKTSFLVGRGRKLPTCYDWSFYAARLTHRRGIQTPAHSEHWAGNASSKGTRKAWLEWSHHSSNIIRNLFSGFNGIWVRCKGSHFTFPWSVAPISTAKQSNPKYLFLHVCTPGRMQPLPNPQTSNLNSHKSIWFLIC